MEQQNQIQEIVEAAILNLRQVAEVNTIIGQPILTSMGATILPVSQVTLGFVAGGGEYGNSEKILKNSYSKQFAGGKMPKSMRRLMGKKGGKGMLGGKMPGLPF